MGCSLIKKPKKNLQLESQYVAQQENGLLNPNIVNFQLSYENNLKLDQSEVVKNQDTQIRTPQKKFLSQNHQRIAKKDKYKAQIIIDLLGEEKECYRRKDDYLLRSSLDQNMLGSPIKKLIQKSDRSIKVRPNKNIIEIF